MSMRFYHQDITTLINKSDPFAQCKLGRSKYARVLTQTVELSNNGFVLAINNEWGTGKTTFLKMWQIQLENEGLNTLYFNAWENDFEDDVLIAFISEFEKLRKSKNKEFKNLVSKAAPLAKVAAKSIGKALINKYVDSKEFNDALLSFSDCISAQIESSINEYAKRKQSLIDFKEALEKYVKATNNKNFVIIIDELDRCNPNYAVKVLECMKHLFSVQGIVFVLSIDKTQLCHSIRGYFGNSEFNAEEYLRRFIDIEYSLPTPSIDGFCKYLYEYYHFDEFLKDKYRVSAHPNDKEELIDFSISLFKLKNVSLRVQERIFAHSRLALFSFQNNNYIYPDLYIFLIYLRNLHGNMYYEIVNKKLSIQQILDKIDNILPDNVEPVNTYIHVVNQLIMAYNYSKSPHQENLFIDNKKEDLNFHTKLYNKADKDYYIRWFNMNFIHGKKYEFNLNVLTQRIDILEELMSS